MAQKESDRCTVPELSVMTLRGTVGFYPIFQVGRQQGDFACHCVATGA